MRALLSIVVLSLLLAVPSYAANKRVTNVAPTNEPFECLQLRTTRDLYTKGKLTPKERKEVKAKFDKDKKWYREHCPKTRKLK